MDYNMVVWTDHSKEGYVLYIRLYIYLMTPPVGVFELRGLHTFPIFVLYFVVEIDPSPHV